MRGDFLEEVQFFAGLPDSVCVLDDGLPARLSAAFAKHPWVEQVQAVEIVGGRRVRVRLAYRTAVLRVVKGDEKWAVDANGVRLPAAAADDALPLLLGVPAPAGQEGQPWGDDRVSGAARTAGLLSAYQNRLTLLTVDFGPDGLTLHGDRWRAVWGAAPGSEPLGETAADEKVRRLLDFVGQHGDAAGELDLRTSPPLP